MSSASEAIPVDTAHRLAVSVADSFGSGPAELLRSGTNHVFAASRTVIRVSPRSSRAQLQVDVARRLTTAGMRVPAPLADPVERAGAVVTVWERIMPTGEPIDFRALGATIARLHRITPGVVADGPLPLYNDTPALHVGPLLDRLRDLDVLGPSDLAVLDDAYAALRGWSDGAASDDFVVCHGDLHPQNVAMAHGEVVVLDWDTICLGPPEWDHVLLMTVPERWGGPVSAYEEFAVGCGADLRMLDSVRRYARLRLLAPTVNLALRSVRDARLAAELERRMQFWRGDPEPAVWTPQ